MRKHLILISLLSLPGCVTVGPRYSEPSVAELQESYASVDDLTFVGDGEIPVGVWWYAYSDPRIAELVEIAREENRDLRVAIHQLEAAKARSGAARRALLPQGTTSFGLTRQRTAPANFAGVIGADNASGDGGLGGDQLSVGTQEFNQYNASSDASWEVDVLGRLRRQAQAAGSRADQQELLLEDTMRLVTAETVDTFILLLESLNRRDVALNNLEAQRETLELTEQLVAFGEAPELDAARLRAQVLTTEAGVLEIKTAGAQALSALALLTAMTVPEFLERYPNLITDHQAPPMPGMDEVVALDKPEEMLRRRPDVRAAERALAAETYDVGVEVAELFPSITLSGSASLTALEFGDLGSETAFGYTAGPSISWNILSLPTLLKDRAASRAEADAALADYERTVLAALTETDESLALYNGAVERARLLSEAEVSALQSLELSEARYNEGADSLLSLLDAQRTALTTQDQAVIAKAAALRARAAVHRALAH
ncbi:MAG: efflux transporter outer membrane subunit [Pseudomonadota bacterium]